MLIAIKGNGTHNFLGLVIGVVTALIFFGLSKVAFIFLGVAGIAVVLVPWSIFYITFVGLGLKLYKMGRLGLVFGHLIGWILAIQVGLVSLS